MVDGIAVIGVPRFFRKSFFMPLHPLPLRIGQKSISNVVPGEGWIHNDEITGLRQCRSFPGIVPSRRSPLASIGCQAGKIGRVVSQNVKRARADVPVAIHAVLHIVETHLVVVDFRSAQR